MNNQILLALTNALKIIIILFFAYLICYAIPGYAHFQESAFPCLSGNCSLLLLWECCAAFTPPPTPFTSDLRTTVGEVLVNTAYLG